MIDFVEFKSPLVMPFCLGAIIAFFATQSLRRILSGRITPKANSFEY
jgi:hypothetical protein